VKGFKLERGANTSHSCHLIGMSNSGAKFSGLLQPSGHCHCQLWQYCQSFRFRRNPDLFGSRAKGDSEVYSPQTRSLLDPACWTPLSAEEMADFASVLYPQPEYYFDSSFFKTSRHSSLSLEGMLERPVSTFTTLLDRH